MLDGVKKKLRKMTTIHIQTYQNKIQIKTDFFEQIQKHTKFDLKKKKV